MKKLKDLLKESFVWERKFGEKLPTLDSIQKKHNQLKEYKGLDRAFARDLREIRMGIRAAERNIKIALKGQGDKEQIVNAKKANQQLQKLNQEFIKLVKLTKVKL